MYKYLSAGVIACLMSSTAIAQTAVSNAAGTGIANSRSTAGALAVSGQGGQGGNGGNVTINSSVPPVQTINQNVSGTTTSNVNSTVSGSTTQHVVSSGTTSIKTNPAVFAPGLSAAGLETCLGSASGGVSVVGFGLTGGSSYPDEGCQARLDSRTLWSYGLKAAAIARLCLRDAIRASMPDVCAKYAPVVTPVGYPAPVVYPTAYASTDIMLIDGKTGRERMCSNYNAAGQKCRQWADAPRPVKLAATSKHRVIAAKPAPAAMPSKEVAAAPAPATTEAAKN